MSTLDRDRKKARVLRIRALAQDQAGSPEGDTAQSKLEDLQRAYGILDEDLEQRWPTYESARDEFSPRYDLLCVLAVQTGVDALPPDPEGIPSVTGEEAPAQICLYRYRVLRRGIESAAMDTWPTLWADHSSKKAWLRFWKSWWRSAISGVLDRVLEDIEAQPEEPLDPGSTPSPDEEETSCAPEASPLEASVQAEVQDLDFFPDAYEIGYALPIPDRLEAHDPPQIEMRTTGCPPRSRGS